MSCCGTCWLLGGAWFQCRYGGFWMSFCRLMFPGVRSSLVFSGFGLKPPASVFLSYSYSSLKTSPTVTSKAVPSVLVSSVCWSLQCLKGVVVDTFLGSLVQSCCGEGGTLQTNNTGICGECSQCLGHTGFAPAHSVCTFPVYTAWALGCSARNWVVCTSQV